MKRFRFGLEKLLELRAYREKEAELELARAVGELTALENRLREVAEERQRIAADRFAPGRSAADMRSAELYIVRLDRTRDELIEASANAELAVEAAREAFAEASRDRKVIDKLKEKHKAEYRKAAADEEIAALDDISGGAAARRETAGSGASFST
jgi:flagellar FliJ protein